MKKILLTDKIYKVVDLNAKKAGLTADELTEATLKRVFNIK